MMHAQKEGEKQGALASFSITSPTSATPSQPATCTAQANGQPLDVPSSPHPQGTLNRCRSKSEVPGRSGGGRQMAAAAAGGRAEPHHAQGLSAGNNLLLICCRRHSAGSDAQESS